MKLVAVFIGAVLFGIGLAASSMTRPEVILAFLHLDDLGLMFVMVGAIAVTAIGLHVVPRILRKPLVAPAYAPLKDILDGRTVAGAAIFGIGWGLSGLCPGSAIATLGTGNTPVALGVLAIFVGAYLRARLVR